MTDKSLKFFILGGMAIGSIFLAEFLTYTFGFWYGSHCIEQSVICPEGVSGQTYTAGDVVTIFFIILIAGYNFSQVPPSMKKIAQGKEAAKRIYNVIDRQPLIVNPENPKIPSNFKGEIKFENVTFAYPKDKSVRILNNLTINFTKGNTALVGTSGCGKSTILQLVLRFYDPDEGRILVDGIDLREIDLVWWRDQVGYVGQ